MGEREIRAGDSVGRRHSDSPSDHLAGKTFPGQIPTGDADEALRFCQSLAALLETQVALASFHRRPLQLNLGTTINLRWSHHIQNRPLWSRFSISRRLANQLVTFHRPIFGTATGCDLVVRHRRHYGPYPETPYHQ